MRTLAGPVLASLSALALFGVRVHVAESWAFSFLPYNLALAWIPLVVSTVALKAPRWAAWPLGVVWMAFLPNAPYLLTDLLHIGGGTAMPVRYDAVMCGAFAVAGLVTGAVSVAHAHAWFERHHGRRIAWAHTGLACLLSGLGVWLGRVHRYNSWDLLEAPGRIGADAAALFTSPTVEPWALSLGIAALLFGVVTLLPPPPSARGAS